MGAYFGAFAKSFQFGGRAPRREYWLFVLFDVIVLVGLVAASELLGANVTLDSASYGGGYVTYEQVTYLRVPVAIYIVLSFFARLSVTARRLHDRNWSGWAILLALLPLLGGLILFIQFVQPGTPGGNGYGEDPLADSGRLAPQAARPAGAAPAARPELSRPLQPEPSRGRMHPALAMAFGGALVAIGWFGWSQREAISTIVASGAGGYTVEAPATEYYEEPLYEEAAPAAEYAYEEPLYDEAAPAAEYVYEEPAYDEAAPAAEYAYEEYAEPAATEDYAYAEPAYDDYAAPATDYGTQTATYAAPRVITVEVCNNSYSTASAAIVYIPVDSNTWQSQGWWSVAPSACATLANTSNGVFYLYAEEEGGSLVWQGDHTDCVSYPGPFTIWDDGSGYCPDGSQTVGFSSIEYGDAYSGGTYTWYLDPP